MSPSLSLIKEEPLPVKSKGAFWEEIPRLHVASSSASLLEMIELQLAFRYEGKLSSRTEQSGREKHVHSQIHCIVYMDAREGRTEKEAMPFRINLLAEWVQKAVGQTPSAHRGGAMVHAWKSQHLGDENRKLKFKFILSFTVKASLAALISYLKVGSRIEVQPSH